jgi:hypothetical protein
MRADRYQITLELVKRGGTLRAYPRPDTAPLPPTAKKAR